MHWNILKKRVDGGPFSIEADANCHMAHRTSVVQVRVVPTVAISVKNSNSEEMEMLMHWTTSIKELKILIHVKKSGNRRTTMKGYRLRPNS